MKIKFREVLEQLMKDSSLSQTEVAKKLKMQQGTIGNWLHGVSIPSLENLWKLADFFVVSIDVLVGKSDYLVKCKTK